MVPEWQKKRSSAGSAYQSTRLPKNAQKHCVWNPDSSPHKRQSDKSYLPNQAERARRVRFRQAPLFAIRRLSGTLTGSNTDDAMHLYHDFYCISFLDDSTNWEGCQYSEQIYSVKFEIFWCFIEKQKNLPMNTKGRDEKIFIPVMHKKHEIYMKTWIFMYGIGLVAQWSVSDRTLYTAKKWKK